MARNLQINQIGEALSSVPGFYYENSNTQATDVTVNSASWFAIQPTTGTHSVDIPVSGPYEIYLSAHPLPQSSIISLQFRIIFNEGEAGEVIVGGNLDWTFRTNNLGQYHRFDMSDIVDLPAGTHTYKAQCSIVNGTGNAVFYTQTTLFQQPKVTIKSITGSGAGGTLIDRYTAAGGLLDASVYNEITSGLELTLHDHTFVVSEGEQVLIHYLQFGRRQLTGVTAPRLNVYLDDVKVHYIHNQIGTQWEYVQLDFDYFTEALAAGPHTIKVKMQSYDAGNSDFNYGASTMDIVKFRGGLIPVQKNGVDTVGTPRALNFIGAGVSDSSGVADINITGPLSAVHTTSFNVVFGINRVNISGGNVTGTLPAANTMEGQIVRIMITATSPNYELTVTDGGSFTQYLQAAGFCSEFYSDGSSWYWLKRGQALIERGVVTSADWAKGDLTEDFAWRSLSLASIIPNAAKGKYVEFAIFFQGTAGNSLTLSTWSDTTQYNYLYVRSQVTGQGDRTTGNVLCSASGIIYYRCSTSTALNIAIRGWWVDV